MGDLKGDKLTYQTKSILDDFLTSNILHTFSITRIKMVTCGFGFVMVLSIEGRVYSWGYGNNGCLGHGNTNSLKSPRIISTLTDKVSYI